MRPRGGLGLRAAADPRWLVLGRGEVGYRRTRYATNLADEGVCRSRPVRGRSPAPPAGGASPFHGGLCPYTPNPTPSRHGTGGPGAGQRPV